MEREPAAEATIQATILDTNVISELVRPEPNPLVSGWYLQQEPEMVYTTAVTLAETLFGLGTMPQGRRRDTLTELTYTIFDDVLYGKILPFDEVAAVQFGRLRSESQQRGRPMEALDAQIAAIAWANGMKLATRNTTDFERCGVPLINPWLALH